DRIEHGRYIRLYFIEGSRLLHLVLGYDNSCPVSLKWKPASEKLIKNNTKRVDIRSWVNIQAATLFWRHIEWCAYNKADLGQTRRWFIIIIKFPIIFCDAEINNFNYFSAFIAMHKDILWFEVPMDYRMLVRNSKSSTYLLHDLVGLSRWEETLLSQS